MRSHLKVSCLLLAAISFFTGCQKKDKQPEEDTFVYTFMSRHAAFSLKFNESDTVYMKSYTGAGSESYALLKNRDSLEALIREVDFAKYDTLYEKKPDPSVDATGIRFYMKKGDKAQSISMIQDGPEELYKTAIRFNQLAIKLQYSPYEGRQYYGTLGQIVSPARPVEIQGTSKNIVE